MDPNARSLDDAQRQLLVLLQQQEELSPALYRDLALYLQVLRDGLLHSVQQACFHLATQVVPERYNQLPSERRQAFQQRLRQLVGRCSSLLTIEQLMALAAQQQRRDQRRQLKRQQELLSALIEGTEASEDRSAPAAPEPAPPAPVGSVSLSLDLPLAADFFDNGVPGLSAPRTVREQDPTPEAEERGPELSLMQSLFELASQGLSADAPPAEAERDGSESADGDGDESEEISDWSAPFQPEVTAAQIPRDPLLQVRWWAHFDRALRFRLRNLSHAVNVEMMRLGLAQGLLPVSLLDAALQARVEALPAPANLLRLALPISLSPAPPEAAPPTEVLTLLLRCSDLEFEQPKLRTCRQRLEQRRRALRTMAKRYRTWQRRVSALEAEQQWFQDSSPHPNPAADRS